jgi:hypothetical protein
MTQTPPVTPMPPAQYARPHRGAMILTFGILSFVCCVLFGVAAWVMGNGDLRQMEAGYMDPSGTGLTQAGKILGMVSVILNLLVIGFYLLIIVLGVGASIFAEM